MDRKVAVVIGAGDALGGAIAKRFARENLLVCVVRRNGDKLAPLVDEIRAAGGAAEPFGVDARKEDQMVELLARIERDHGAIEVAVFNIGANVSFGILETTARVYFKVWEMACFAGFLLGREAARHMLPRGRGTILFTGSMATTSVLIEGCTALPMIRFQGSAPVSAEFLADSYPSVATAVPHRQTFYNFNSGRPVFSVNGGVWGNRAGGLFGGAPATYTVTNLAGYN